MVVTFQGNPMTLEGNHVQVGDKAPKFVAVTNQLETVSSETLKGKRIYVSVPSLDTEVCDLEVRRFNQEAANIKDVNIYVISMDLPFAQSRWCGSKGVDHVTTLSDYKAREFGENFGVYIKELGLLTRAVFVVDDEDNVVYTEYCNEITNEPNYEAALAALAKL